MTTTGTRIAWVLALVPLLGSTWSDTPPEDRMPPRQWSAPNPGPDHELALAPDPTPNPATTLTKRGAAAKATLPPRAELSHRRNARGAAVLESILTTNAAGCRAVGGRAPAPAAAGAAATARLPALHAGGAPGCGGCTESVQASAPDARATLAAAAPTPAPALPSASIDREVFVTALRMVTR